MSGAGHLDIIKNDESELSQPCSNQKEKHSRLRNRSCRSLEAGETLVCSRNCVQVSVARAGEEEECSTRLGWSDGL